MRIIPNIITVLRIFMSAILLFLEPFSPLFLIAYSICGFSDLIDGYIARKTNSASKLGSVLDSIADIVFIGAAFIVILPVISISTGLLVWIMLITFVRIISMLIVYYKHHTFAILHTYVNKATGLLMFFIPYLCSSIDINIIGSVICIIASISAVEELIIHITSSELSRDARGFFLK